jgi:hypothetical protein
MLKKSIVALSTVYLGSVFKYVGGALRFWAALDVNFFCLKLVNVGFCLKRPFKD